MALETLYQGQDPTLWVSPLVPRTYGIFESVVGRTATVKFRGEQLECRLPGDYDSALIAPGQTCSVVYTSSGQTVWAIPYPINRSEYWLYRLDGTYLNAELEYPSYYRESITDWINDGKVASAAVRYIMDKNRKYNRYEEAFVVSFDIGTHTAEITYNNFSTMSLPVKFGADNGVVDAGDRCLIWRDPGDVFYVIGGQRVNIGVRFNIAVYGSFTNFIYPLSSTAITDPNAPYPRTYNSGYVNLLSNIPVNQATLGILQQDMINPLLNLTLTISSPLMSQLSGTWEYIPGDPGIPDWINWQNYHFYKRIPPNTGTCSLGLLQDTTIDALKEATVIP